MTGKTNAVVSGGGGVDTNTLYVNPMQTSLYEACSNSGSSALLPATLTLDLTNATNLTNMYRAFYNQTTTSTAMSMTKLIIVGTTPNVISYDLFVCRQRELAEIDGTLDFTSVNADNHRPFLDCLALQEVRFVQGSIHRTLTLADCSQLSLDSLASIVDGLATVSGKTLTLHATAKAKLTQTQLDTISSKGWTLA